jgi:hypothetical protein
MIVALLPRNWHRLIVWTAVGFAIYAFYGYRHSRLHKANNGTGATTQEL